MSKYIINNEQVLNAFYKLKTRPQIGVFNPTTRITRPDLTRPDKHLNPITRFLIGSGCGSLSKNSKPDSTRPDKPDNPITRPDNTPTRNTQHAYPEGMHGDTSYIYEQACYNLGI